MLCDVYTTRKLTVEDPKRSQAPSGKTTGRIKKVRGSKMGRTSFITVPSMVGIVGRAPAVECRRKRVMFLYVCLSRFGITKFVITETL